MAEILVAVGFALVLIAIFSVPCGLFNVKMFRATQESKPGGLELVKAFFPFANILYSRKLCYGKCPVFLSLLIVSVVLLAFRFIALALLTIVPVLIVFSPFAVLASFILYYIIYAANAVDFCRMLGGGGFVLLVCVFCAPLGYYMLSNKVLPYFKTEEDTLSARFGT